MDLKKCFIIVIFKNLKRAKNLCNSHVTPSHRRTEIAASAADPPRFKISAPISAHSCPLAETAP